MASLREENAELRRQLNRHSSNSSQPGHAGTPCPTPMSTTGRTGVVRPRLEVLGMVPIGCQHLQARLREWHAVPLSVATSPRPIMPYCHQAPSFCDAH